MDFVWWWKIVIDSVTPTIYNYFINEWDIYKNNKQGGEIKLWKLSQTHVRENGYYRDVLVAAETEEDAKNTDINSGSEYYAIWVDPRHVNVEYLGEAKEGTEAGFLFGEILS